MTRARLLEQGLNSCSGSLSPFPHSGSTTKENPFLCVFPAFGESRYFFERCQFVTVVFMKRAVFNLMPLCLVQLKMCHGFTTPFEI